MTNQVILRHLEQPYIYNILTDELYEINNEAFNFLLKCLSDGHCYSDEKDFIDFCLSENILTEKPTKPLKHKVRKSPEPSLRYLEFLITDRCNLKCKHCYVGDTEYRDIPFEAMVKVLDEFEEIQGLRLIISGGEPLMHPEFDDLNEFLKGYPLRKILLTNGILLTEKRLKNLHVEEIQISIDGIGHAHEMLRGKDTFDKTLNSLKRAMDYGFQVSVSTMIHPGNIEQFDDMERLFESLGVKEWIVDVPCMTGRMGKELYLPPYIGGRYLRYGFGGGFHGGAEGYGCGLHLCSVLPDGKVAKCAFYGDRAVGHISDGLEECWKKIEQIRLVEACSLCDFANECRGGCRYRAELLGDSEGRDLYKCFAYERDD